MQTKHQYTEINFKQANKHKEDDGAQAGRFQTRQLLVGLLLSATEWKEQCLAYLPHGTLFSNLIGYFLCRLTYLIIKYIFSAEVS